METGKLFVLFEELQRSYLRAERLMLKKEIRSVVKELVPVVQGEFVELLLLISLLPEGETIPGTTCCKVDRLKSHAEWKSNVGDWLCKCVLHQDVSPDLDVKSRSQGCGTGSWKRKRWKRSFFCGSGSAKILPLPHRLFDLKSNMAKQLSVFQRGLNGEVAL